MLGALDSWAGVSPTTGTNKAHAWVPFWGLTFMGRETLRALITVGVARDLHPSLLTLQMGRLEGAGGACPRCWRPPDSLFSAPHPSPSFISSLPGLRSLLFQLLPWAVIFHLESSGR